MNPRLISISGPLKGSSFAITAEISIGREGTNAIALRDTEVSRRHCILKQQEGQFLVVDLNSRNGTIVNGVPVKERMLEEGDRISIGKSDFLFVTKETEPTPDVSLTEPFDFVSLSTTQLKLENSIYLLPEKVLARSSLNARISRSLNALLKISKVIHTISGADALLQKLMDLLFETFPADHAGLALLDRSERIASACVYDRQTGIQPNAGVSQTVINEILRRRDAILSNDLMELTSSTPGKSLKDIRLTSILAVPLFLFEHLYGVLYLGRRDTQSGFEEDDLHLLAAISAIAVFAIEKNRRLDWLEDENDRLRSEIEIEHSMIGESPSMQKLYQMIARVAPVNTTVFITGDSGTGKELVARAIHKNSPRGDHPFVAINCAALTETLLESELFGHEKGAFTGAIGLKKGKLEIANGGTVFLDEIGELSAGLQSKLLRVLQEREFDRVGGTRPIQMDVRFMAATNRDIQEAMKAGTFREDLYFRLNVVSIKLPSLRERREDIPLLAIYFVSKYAAQIKRGRIGISGQARDVLMRYDWPGNVRELENAMEYAVVMATTDSIEVENLPESVIAADTRSGDSETTFHQAVIQAKREIIRLALDRADGNFSDAARALGIHPNNFHRLLRSLHLKS